MLLLSHDEIIFRMLLGTFHDTSVFSDFKNCVLFCLLKDKKVFNGFSPKVWPKVNLKIIDMTRRPKLCELRQHPHTISFARHNWFTQKRGFVFEKTKKDASVKASLSLLCFIHESSRVFHWRLWILIFSHCKIWRW